jgi:uncharacterized cupredoxin-like copper-binding protein
LSKIRNAFVLSVAACLLISVTHAATPPQIVNVKLQDSGESAMAGMRVVLDVEKVKAGRVTVVADNQSKNLVHEVVVVAVTTPGKALPYDEKKQQVIENRVRRLGEISDLKPGASGKLMLNLRPGTYLLICNQPGHYKAGMSATLAVEK